MLAVPASIAAMRGGLPAWLGWAGVLAGLASVATLAFVGIFAWMAWIAVASIVLFVAPAREGWAVGSRENGAPLGGRGSRRQTDRLRLRLGRCPR